jgi:broad-specificity NMP kinase
MSDYSFDTLNDSDFEEFVNDLLSKILSQKVERFKKGRDKGIDGRLSHVDGTNIIVQSKHYIGSSFATLKSHLKSSERPKLDKLNDLEEHGDIRYIFATSQGLSSSEVDELETIFHPYLKKEDIYWKQKLNDFLKDFPDVERMHYKLWLRSSNVLQNLLTQDIDFETESELEKIEKAAKVYTKTKLHVKAKNKLDKDQCVIIIGDPGVGKTTLARMLCNDYLIEQSENNSSEDDAESFEFVYIESDMKDAAKKFKKRRNQIFLFDDFLGRNYLSAITNSHDSRIVKFIERVKRDPSKRFVLTSRVTVLNQGRLRSDELKTDKIDNAQFIFDANELEDIDKARILYNHLFFAKSPEHLFYDHVTELFKKKRYRTIIEHRNYNPRVMEFILSPAQLAEVKPSRYWDFIRKNLDKPDEIWESAIKNQLGDLEQVILWHVTFSKDITEEALRAVIEEYFEKRGKALNVYDFTDALKTLADAFLHKIIWNRSGQSYWSLSNPSIADYVSPTLINDNTSTLIEIVIALGKNLSFSTLPSIRLLKLVQKPVLNGIAFWDKLLSFLQSNSLSESHFELTMRGLDNYIRESSLTCNKYRDLIEEVFNLYNKESLVCDYSVENIEFLEKLSDKLKGKHVGIDWQLLCSLCLAGLNSHDELVEFSNVYNNIERISGYSIDLVDDLTDKVLDNWYGEIDSHISNKFNADILIGENDIVSQFRQSGDLDEESCKDVIDEHINEIIEDIEGEYESNIDIADTLKLELHREQLYEIAFDALNEHVELEEDNFMGTGSTANSLFDSEDSEDDEDDEIDEDEDDEDEGEDDEIDDLFSQ